MQEWAEEDIENRIEKIRTAILQPENIFLVAEAFENIIGFGVAQPKNNFLDLLYTIPNSFGRVGYDLLSDLINLSLNEGCTYFETKASGNAENFYILNGFKVISREIYTLKSGKTMDSIKMRIDF